MTPRSTKSWPTAGGRVKDREMMRATRTRLATGGAFTRGNASPVGTWLRCALLLGVLGCENRAPAVQREPDHVAPAPAEPVRAEAPVGNVAPTLPSASQSPVGQLPVGQSPPPAAAAGTAAAPHADPAQHVDLAKYEARAGGTPAKAAAGNAQPPAGAAAAEGPSTTSKAEPTLGAVVNGDAFSTWLQAPSPAPVGAVTYVEAVLVAKAPYHCNAEYPHKFKLGAPSPGVTYPEETVRGMQVTPERSVLRIPLQAANAGLVKVSGALSFSVCTEERCLVEKRELSLDLEVK
jgi:hypothetical protein